MNSCRLHSSLLAITPWVLGLVACGSDGSSSGLWGITQDSAVVLNEICSSGDRCRLSAFCTDAYCAAATNGSACEDACSAQQLDTHGSDDWVELYNLTGQDVELEGYYLGDHSKAPLETRLPGGTIVQAHGYLLLFANGRHDDSRDLGFSVHDGESVVLSGPTGEWLDQLATRESTTGGKTAGTWARIPDGTGPQPDDFCFFPTPGWQNYAECPTSSP
jgi:hypothetical protein